MRFLICVLILLSFAAKGQNTDQEAEKRYRKISKRSVSTPESVSYSTYHLANYLVETAESDLEKVRSFYVWISNNITYDMIGFENNNLPDYRPKAVLFNRVAVCGGYARLFAELCAEAGIRAEVINGYSKGYGYIKNQKFDVVNHAWNAVYLDNQWQLIDVTWATRQTNDVESKRPVNDFYFLTSPEEFVLDHLPEIPAWQLLGNPINKVDFEDDNIVILSGSFNYDDSLSLLLDAPKQDQTITYQLMARDFDPYNDAANYELGLEYRFQGLETLESVYNVEVPDTSVFNRLEKTSFASFDEAALYFTLIKPGSRYYKSAQIFLDDTDFERGVFKYEVSHRMIEIFNKYSQEEKLKNRKRFEELILQNYEEASSYFEKIPRHSWYYEKAQEYLNEYLVNPFEGT